MRKRIFHLVSITAFCALTLTTPAAEDNAQAAAAPGTILEDDFVDNRNKWLTADTDTGEYAIRDGGYRIRFKPFEKGFRYIYKEIDLSALDDFTIEAVIRHESGSLEKGFGVFWGMKDSDSFITFNLSGNGGYRFGRNRLGRWTEAVPWKSPTFVPKEWTIESIVRQTGQANTVFIRKIRDYYHFFINGIHVNSALYTGFRGDRFGFIAWAPMELTVERLSVKRVPPAVLPPPPRLPAVNYDAINAKAKVEFVPQNGHAAGGIFSVPCAVSPDARLLASGDPGGRLLIWQRDNGKLLRTVNGGQEMIMDVVFLPDGLTVATASADGTIRLWRVADGALLRTLRGHEKVVSAIALSPRGDIIASAGEDKTVRLWRTADGKLIRTITGHTDKVFCVAISPDGRLLASGSADKSVRLWDAAAGKQLALCLGHKALVRAVAFSPDGKTFVSGGNGYGLIVWEAPSGKMVKTLGIWNESIESLAFSPDGLRLASSDGPRLALWDWEKMEKIWEMNDDSGDGMLAFSPDGSFVAAGRADGLVRLRSVVDGAEILSTRQRSFAVSRVAVSPDRTLLAVQGSDSALRFWDLKSGRLIRTIGTAPLYLKDIAFSRDGKILIGALSDEKEHGKTILRYWDSATGKQVNELSGQAGVVYSLDLSPDGRRIMTAGGTQDKPISVFETATGKIVRSYPVQKLAGGRSLQWARFSPDGKRIMFKTFDYDRRAYLLDVETGAIALSLSLTPFVTIENAVFSPDSSLVVTSSYLGDHKVRIWNARSGVPLTILSDNPEYAESLAFSPDGRLLATGHGDSRIMVYSMPGGRLIKALAGHTSTVSSLRFLDADTLVSGSWDGTARVWSLKDSSYVALLSNERGNLWLNYTSDGYWDASRYGGELVAVVKGLEAFNIDQLSFRSNRPDIVIERLRGSPALIARYREQHFKRLRRLGLSSDAGRLETELPSAVITKSVQSDKVVDLEFTLSGRNASLKAYHLFVNDVAVFGADGKPVAGKRADRKAKVELTEGKNKIEVSCTNAKGAESYRAVTYAAYAYTPPRDLYVIAVGVSRYRDASLTLRYAAKDAQDLAAALGGLKEQFGEVHLKVLVDENATRPNILAAKEFLTDARVDDMVVLFIAGHGKHDADPASTYYFLTHEADPANLAGSALNFERIEELLQGVAPRYKLFLMDTCESGEIDPGEELEIAAASQKNQVAARGLSLQQKAATAAPASSRKTALLDKDRFIYNDLVRRSGAIVLSSSAGAEYSYESDRLKQGLFTAAILAALKDPQADRNGDGTVSVEELRRYVQVFVSKATDGLQNPTIDRDNIYLTFGFDAATAGP